MNNEDVGKLESFTADRIEYSVVTLENSLAVPQKVKHRIILWPYNSTPMYIPKRIKTYVHTYIYTHKK